MSVSSWYTLDAALTEKSPDKLSEFATLMGIYIDDFRKKTELKLDAFNAANWDNFIPFCSSGGGQLSQSTVLVLGYILLNLCIFNKDKYPLKKDSWIMRCCCGQHDGGLPSFLAVRFKYLFENENKNGYIEYMKELRTTVFVCIYNYRYVRDTDNRYIRERIIEEIDVDFIESRLKWYFDLYDF